MNRSSSTLISPLPAFNLPSNLQPKPDRSPNFLADPLWEPVEDRPLVRLLLGNAAQPEPEEAIATIFSDGRCETASGLTILSQASLVPLRTRLRRLQKLTQAELDAQIDKSRVPPPDKDTAPRYGLELRTVKGQIYLLSIAAPLNYRYKRLPKINTFLAALDAVADLAGIDLKS